MQHFRLIARWLGGFEVCRFLVMMMVLAMACRLAVVDGMPSMRYRDILNSHSQQTEPITLFHDEPDSWKDVEELYITQKLDHFDPSNKATFQQRYFTTSRYQIDQRDATRRIHFLCVGGEGPALDKSVLVDSVHCSGDMLELAKILSMRNISVSVYALEHRYYGKSYPAFHGNTSTDDDSPVTTAHLKYLSSRQALEDLAHFVRTRTMLESEIETNTTTAETAAAWITFGGSYPGYMAGNARLKYPHLIYGAVSSSVPLDLKVDFPEYKQRQGWDLRYAKVGGSDTCWNIVKQGHEQAKTVDPQTLGTMFHVCHPETALINRQNLNLLLGDGLIDIPAQGNDPSCNETLCNIAKLCEFMVTTRQASHNVTDLEILASVARIQQNRTSRDDDDYDSDGDDDCIQVDWNQTLAILSNPNNTWWRSWLWQTCTEVGFYQTCHETCPFTSFYHLVDMDLEICRVAFNITDVYDNVQASKDFYGGLDIGAGGSRVLSINGNVDPWSVLGIQISPKYSMPVRMVDGASHHFWTHPLRATDAPEIAEIRKYIYSVVMEWLGVEDSSNNVMVMHPAKNDSVAFLRAGEKGNSAAVTDIVTD